MLIPKVSQFCSSHKKEFYSGTSISMLVIGVALLILGRYLKVGSAGGISCLSTGLVTSAFGFFGFCLNQVQTTLSQRKPPLPKSSSEPLLPKLTEKPSPAVETCNVEPEPPLNLEVQTGKLTTGQGVYLVHYPQRDNKELSPEMFEKVYAIFNRYSPQAILDRGGSDEDCLHRYTHMVQEIREQVDTSLEITFIPRILYEMFFSEQCLREDYARNGKGICPEIHFYQKGSLSVYTDQIMKNAEEARVPPKRAELEAFREKYKIESNCWHLACFDEHLPGYNEHEGVKKVAYRLNQLIVQRLNPSDEGFTYEELASFAEEQIAFFDEHHRDIGKKLKLTPQLPEEMRRDWNRSIIDWDTPNPTAHFGLQNSEYSSIKGVWSNDGLAGELIRKILQLECSKEALGSLFIFRGGDFEKDTPQDKEGYYRTISYGEGALSGVLFDGGATAFHYLLWAANAYALAIRFKKLKNSMFYTTGLHPLVSLFAKGEHFHARTRIPKNINKKVDGIEDREEIPEFLMDSEQSEEQLISEFKEYKRMRAVQLRGTRFSSRY